MKSKTTYSNPIKSFIRKGKNAWLLSTNLITGEFILTPVKILEVDGNTVTCKNTKTSAPIVCKVENLYGSFQTCIEGLKSESKAK